MVHTPGAIATSDKKQPTVCVTIELTQELQTRENLGEQNYTSAQAANGSGGKILVHVIKPYKVT